MGRKRKDSANDHRVLHINQSINSFAKYPNAVEAFWQSLVGLSRFELLTPRLSSVCSNQLSYRPSSPPPQIVAALSPLSKNRLAPIPSKLDRRAHKTKTVVILRNAATAFRQIQRARSISKFPDGTLERR